MIYPIVRMYRSAEQATTAVRKLHQAGFTSDLVDLVTAATTENPGGADDPVVALIVGGYVLKRHATIYAPRIRRGAALVIVRAPFSFGREATEILDSCDPIESGVPLRADPGTPWNEATPLSSILWIAVLADNSSGLSSFWNLPLLTRTGRTLGAVLGIGALASSASSLSRALGLPLLARSPAPLSSALRIPLLA